MFSVLEQKKSSGQGAVVLLHTPITDAKSLAIDGNLFPEQRMQELMDCWLTDRFTGQPITVDGLEPGSTEQRTFTKCNIGWGDRPMPEGPEPFLHLFPVGMRSVKRAIKPWTIQKKLTWTVQAMVKVPRNQTGTNNAPMPEQIARRVAAEFEWLFASTEKHALLAVGIERPTIQSPSAEVATSQWAARAIIFECSLRQEFPRRMSG